jgi:phosphoribosyl-AMP cyclohydrolase
LPVTDFALPFGTAGDKAALETGAAFAPRFGADGLVTAVVQDADSGAVLMVGHMNAEALARTIETGEGWFWSRSRAALWHKGATSGNSQRVVELLVDCDQDAVVLRVRVDGHGATCHTGRVSCFYRRVTLGGDAAQARLEDVGDPALFDPAEVYGR